MRRDQRNREIYEYLTTLDSEGYHPSYRAASAKFAVSRQRIAQVFCEEYKRADDAGEVIPELQLREGRVADSVEEFLSKHGAVVDALRSGQPAKHILREHDLSKSTLYWIRARALEFNLLTTPAKEVRPKKHVLPVSALRSNGFIEIALDSPEAKKALASFFGTGA